MLFQYSFRPFSYEISFEQLAVTARLKNELRIKAIEKFSFIFVELKENFRFILFLSKLLKQGH